MHYAIDFGTSNTVIARINGNGEIETLRLEHLSQLHLNNPPLVPSLVFVENAESGRVVIGQTVRDRGLDFKNNQRFFQNFKRAIAQPLTGFMPELDGTEISPVLVGHWFLTEVIRQLPDVTSLVLTVPVDSFESYRQWLAKICTQLDVAEIRILDEPTAAALGYGLSRGNETVLVIDMGGGTLDMSLVRLNFDGDKHRNQVLGFLLKWGDRTVNNQVNQQKPAIAKVIAKIGQNLGGIDIDNWLVDYFHTAQGLPKNSLITRLAEKLKIALSTSLQATEVFFDDETITSYCLELGRSQFQNILESHDFFSRLNTALDQIKQQAQRQGYELKDVEAVLLVGGTAQIPAVYNWIAQHFSTAKIKCSQPFEAIAHGALNQIQLQDFLYHSYGVRYWDKRLRQHNWHPIIKSGETYPTQPVELILGASQTDQSSLELVIGELGTNLEVYFDNAALITRNLKHQTAAQPLKQVIAPLDPLGQLGIDRLKVLFTVDTQRTLHICIEDLLTHKIILPNQAVIKLM